MNDTKDPSAVGSPHGRRWQPSPDLASSVVLIFIGILFFSDVLFSSKNFYFRDILNFHYPLRKVLIAAYARGEFPLWNPFIYLGQPLLANPNCMAFYPTNLLHLFLSFNYAFKLHFILHPLLAGLGAYILQRKLGILPLVSFGGALIYEFSGTVLSFLNLYNIVPAVALLPWIGWSFLRSIESRSRKRLLLFGLLLVLQVIAFEPLLFLCVVLLLAALALIHLLQSDNRGAAVRGILRTGAIGGVFAFALAAIQVFPALELIPLCARGARYDYSTSSAWSMHPADLANLGVSNLFGSPYTVNASHYWGERFHESREPYLVSFFVGSSALLLASFSFLSHRRLLQRTLVGLFVIASGMALGRFNPFFHWLYERLFLIRLGRYPSKYFLLGTLALAVLASLGLEVVLTCGEDDSSRRRRLRLPAIAGIIASAACLGLWIYLRGHPEALDGWMRSMIEPGILSLKDLGVITAQFLASIRYLTLFLSLSSVLVLVSSIWPRPILTASLLILVTGAELLPANLRLSALISDADVDYVSEVEEYVAKNGPREPFRVSSPTALHPMPNLKLRVPNPSRAWLTLFNRRTGQPFYGITEGIQYSPDRSVDQLNTRDSEDMWKALVRLPEATALTLLGKLNTPMLLSLEEIHDPRVQLIATFDTHSDVQLKLYWLNNAVARAYFVSGVQYAPIHREALEIYLRPDFPYGNTIVMENPYGISRPGETGAGSARVLDYQDQRVLCEVQAQVPGYLVLLDSYYPGWHAYVDGSEVEILRANFAFRAVAVPPGKHRVEYIYRPRLFYAGLTLTVLAALTGIALLHFCSRNSL